MLKLAQMETVMELQQAEIHNLGHQVRNLTEWKRRHMEGEHKVAPIPADANLLQVPEHTAEEVARTALMVLRKFRHQRNQAFRGGRGTSVRKGPSGQQPDEAELLRQRQAAKSTREAQLLDKSATWKPAPNPLDAHATKGDMIEYVNERVGQAVKDFKSLNDYTHGTLLNLTRDIKARQSFRCPH